MNKGATILLPVLKRMDPANIFLIYMPVHIEIHTSIELVIILTKDGILCKIMLSTIIDFLHHYPNRR
jgi:hypothetical protein